ncbi:unnamed protein product [Oreochromis niloticus]|nr:unnamed protein product [Mustela putorius furo]
MFEFIWKQKTLCIDGALEDGSFGRLVNDEHRTPNCRMKLIEAEGKPHLCLFALKEIAAGSEITYDYGGKEWPWRKKLKIASIPSGQQCVAEPIAHDVEHHVISTDSFTDRELRAECQSSRPTADNSEHECTIHRLVFESVKLDKCGICHSPLTAIRWHGLRCKQCRCVWHKICLQTSSEDWDMSDGDVSSDEEYIPNSASDSESSGTELSIELPGPSKNSHAASMPDLCVTFAEKEQTMDVKNNFEHILNDLETTDDLHPDQEPDSSESCQQKTKDACSEKSTVDISQNESPTNDGHYRGQFGQFADACGAEHPQNLRSTNLRKQIATISQVMNLKDNELDQLADFLGHDIRVHREYYQVPQSTIQLAKISKLLMAMEKGSVKDIQGKTLDEIGDDIDGMATGSQQLPDASTLRDDQGNDACVTSGSPPVPDSVTKGLRVSSRRCVKRPWSEEEIGAVMKHMKPFIENGITVTNQQCLKCKEKEQPILETRSIQNIRDFVRNRGLAFKKNK